jgi:hypothetical protein
LITAGDLAKHECGNAIRDLWAAVRSRLADQVCEVNALAEEVACARGFWRRNPHSLGKDSHKVGEAASVPEQLPVLNLVGIKDLCFAFALNLEAIDEFEASAGTGVLHVSVNHLERVVLL